MITPNDWKEKGNALAKQKKYKEALDCYTKGIELAPNNQILFSNRSLMHYNLGEFNKAIEDAEKAILLKPDFVKAYFRKGKALESIKNHKNALDAYKLGLEIDKNNSLIKEALVELETKLKQKEKTDDNVNKYVIAFEEENKKSDEVHKERKIHHKFKGENEKFIDKYPLPVTMETTNIILNQMERCICKIENNLGKGTGFFCYINIPNKKEKLKVFITNNHIINKEILDNEDKIKVYLNDGKERKTISLRNRKKYTSEIYDTTIIEINQEEDKISNFLELDDEEFDECINKSKNSIYILQYPQINNERKASVSYGILDKIEDEFEIIHKCSTERGASGSPILKISNRKVIGIHKLSMKEEDYNAGTFLKFPVKEYLDNNSTINLTLKIEKDDINKDIYFLDNTNNDFYIEKDIIERHHHDNLIELNESNVDLFINDVFYKYKKFFNPKIEGLYKIKLIIHGYINDCSFMFCNCSNIINIDLASFNTKFVTNMKYMFSGCSKLKNLNLSSFYTKNVIKMMNMFENCSNLVDIDLSSFDTKKVNNIQYMFANCSNLANVNLSSFNTKNVYDMSFMFSGCSLLTNIDLFSFDTENVTNMCNMFSHCSNLIYLNLSSFNTKNVSNMIYMFFDSNKISTVKINNCESNLKLLYELYSKNANIIDQYGNFIKKESKIVMDKSLYYFIKNMNNLNFNGNHDDFNKSFIKLTNESKNFSKK